MASYFYKNKMSVLGGCIVKLLVVVILLFTSSCNNMIELKGKQGSLSIAVPGGRATTDNLSYTVSITGSAGSSQTKTVPSGQTVTFEELTPGTYTIAVEGKEKVESTTTTPTEKVVSYGTSSATVTAGKTSSATVTLVRPASTFTELQKAVEETGGTVYIDGDISVTEGLTINKNVKLVGVGGDVKIINETSTDETTEAVPLFTVSTGGNLTLDGGSGTLTLDGNSKAAYGIEVKSKGNLTLEKNSTISKAGKSGVYVSNASFTMNGGTIRDNTSDSSGGGVHVFAGTFVMNDGQITNNSSTKENTGTGGGGVYFDLKSSFTMNGGSIDNNSSITRGGGIYARGKFVLSDGLITKNKVTGTSALGGGIFSEKEIQIKGSTISYNSATEGGGIYVDGGTVTISDGSINNNTATKGGGVYLKTGFSSIMTGGNISNNSATEGGGIYKGNMNYFNLEGGVINLNNATKDGGGVFVCGDKFTMSGGEITQNTATTSGGGVHVSYMYDDIYGYYLTGIFEMTAGDVGGNEATKGDQVYVGSGSYSDQKAIFKIGDSATLKGGEVYLSNSAASVSIILTSPLTSGGTIATITPEKYSGEFLSVEEDSGVKLKDEVSKFRINKADDDSNNYYIDENGQIVTVKTQ